MNSLAAQNPAHLMFTASSRLAEIPKFIADKCRWSVVRNLSVEDLAKEWISNPHRVCVFEDKKLSHTPLVMLRKDHFEVTVKLLEDLQNGEAAIQHNIRTLFRTVELVQNLTSRLVNIPDHTEDVKNLQQAVTILSEISGQIQSTYILANPIKKMEPSKLTDEERRLAAED